MKPRIVVDTNLWIRALLGGPVTQPILEAWRGQWVEATTVPPRCRDPKDHPVLATALSGGAHAIVSGDGDLRADDNLRQQMLERGVQIWGVETLLAELRKRPEAENGLDETGQG
jgi:predicted nucleic acid-binding protein